jgi:hypothetical protein
MTEPVQGARGGALVCLDDTRERLEAAADALEADESELRRELELALVGTVKVAVLCAGGASRMQSPSCVIAAAQHVHTLLDLSQRAEDYQRDVEEYQAALAAHLACLAR